MILALGKDRKAYLLERDDLGGIGGQLAGATVSDIRIMTSPAACPVGNDIIDAFQAQGTQCPGPGKGNGLTVLKISGGSPPKMNTAWCGGLSGRGFRYCNYDGRTLQSDCMDPWRRRRQSASWVPRRYGGADRNQRTAEWAPSLSDANSDARPPVCRRRWPRLRIQFLNLPVEAGVGGFNPSHARAANALNRPSVTSANSG